MLIDKPGDDPAESEREPESVDPMKKNNAGAVPLRKTKQQRRKAEKLRAEVRQTALLSHRAPGAYHFQFC